MLSYRKKIFIDRVFGSFIALILNIITRLFGIILRRSHEPCVGPKAIVVAKIVGIGSILHSGVLCRALKEKYPRAKIIFVTSSSSREFVAHMNYIDEIMTIDDNGLSEMVISACSLILKLWSRRPELYFDLELYSNWSSILATFSLARNRYGFFRKSASFRMGLHSHLLFFNTNKYLADIYLLLGKSAAAEGSNNLEGLLRIEPEDRQKEADFLSNLGVSGSGYIVVNPNVSELLLERRWPIEKWKLFLDIAVRLWPEAVFLLAGAPSEEEYTAQLYGCLKEDCRQNVKNITGRLPLGAYLALVEGCRAMVTCDSGPMHIAISLGRPTLSIWGPGSPQHYAPYKDTHRIIYEPIYCSPCLYHADFPPCGGDNQCLKRIPVRTVLSGFARLINLPFNEDGPYPELINDDVYVEQEKNTKRLLGFVKGVF